MRPKAGTRGAFRYFYGEWAIACKAVTFFAPEKVEKVGFAGDLG